MTWPKKRQWQRQIQRQRQLQRQIQLENTFRERSKRLVTFQTFDQSDEETWPDQKKRRTKTNTKTKTMTKTNTIREPCQRAILETCDLWDIWSEWWEDLTWPKKWLRQRQWQWQRQIQRQWQRQTKGLVTFETLITILKIENLNLWQSLLPDNKEWHWTAFAILAMFIYKAHKNPS